MKTSCLPQIRRYKLGLNSPLDARKCKEMQGNARLRVSKKVMDSNPQGPGRVGDVNQKILKQSSLGAEKWRLTEVI